MISVLDRSSIVQSFKIIKFKKSNYDFWFRYFKYSWNVLKLNFKINFKKIIMISVLVTSSSSMF